MESLDLKTIVGLITTVILAVAGYLYKYIDGKKTRKRQSKLLLINKRLEEFYGPLYFQSDSGEKSYQELLEKSGKQRVSINPTDEDLKEWRVWYKNVFHPYNLGMEKIILEKSYLILEEEIPQTLLDFISHISPYKAIVAKWDNKDYSEHFSRIPFPKDFKSYIHRSYKTLKKEQLKLINT